MNDAVLVAVLSFAGTIVGSLFGIVASSKLVNFRLKKLEEKVEKHNTVIERTFVLEGKVAELRHDYSEVKSELKKKADK